MIEAYEEKQQELRTLKRAKSKRSTKGTKKRGRQEEDQAFENDEVCLCLHLPISALATFPVSTPLPSSPSVLVMACC